MSKIERLSDIQSVTLHWSESKLINDEIGSDEDCDIDKNVDIGVLDDLIRRASREVGGGYDKTSMSVVLNSGIQWCKDSKFYLTSDRPCLLSLLNS